MCSWVSLVSRKETSISSIFNFDSVLTLSLLWAYLNCPCLTLLFSKPTTKGMECLVGDSVILHRHKIR